MKSFDNPNRAVTVRKRFFHIARHPRRLGPTHDGTVGADERDRAEDSPALTTTQSYGAATVRKRFFHIAGFAACVMLLLAAPACMRSQKPLRIYMPATLLIGENVPTLAEGQWFHSDGVTSTDSYRGKVVVLQFGFTACASCAEFAPRFNAVLDKYADHDVVVIHVMDGRLDDEKSIRRYIKDREVKGPVVLDVNGEIFERLQITASPSVFVVNGAGKILWWQATVREALVDEWILEALAQNRKVATHVSVDAG